jgi:hypothetical protein
MYGVYIIIRQLCSYIIVINFINNDQHFMFTFLLIVFITKLSLSLLACIRIFFCIYFLYTSVSYISFRMQIISIQRIWNWRLLSCRGFLLPLVANPNIITYIERIHLKQFDSQFVTISSRINSFVHISMIF